MSATSEVAAATPTKTSRMLKAQQTDEAAWAVINAEAAARAVKTRALRAMRLESETSGAAQQAKEPVVKARKTTARVRRSRQK